MCGCVCVYHIAFNAIIFFIHWCSSNAVFHLFIWLFVTYTELVFLVNSSTVCWMDCLGWLLVFLSDTVTRKIDTGKTPTWTLTNPQPQTHIDRHAFKVQECRKGERENCIHQQVFFHRILTLYGHYINCLNSIIIQIQVYWSIVEMTWFDIKRIINYCLNNSCSHSSKLQLN